jgi:hypothetical protein
MGPALLVAASLTVACAAAGELIEGEITLSAPQCPLFVVHTSEGFSVLNEQEYFGVYEGDHVRGLLHSPGLHPIEVIGELTVDATVETWGIDRDQATRVFHRHCKTRPVVNHERD